MGNILGAIGRSGIGEDFINYQKVLDDRKRMQMQDNIQMAEAPYRLGMLGGQLQGITRENELKAMELKKAKELEEYESMPVTREQFLREQGIEWGNLSKETQKQMEEMTNPFMKNFGGTQMIERRAGKRLAQENPHVIDKFFTTEFVSKSKEAESLRKKISEMIDGNEKDEAQKKLTMIESAGKWAFSRMNKGSQEMAKDERDFEQDLEIERVKAGYKDQYDIKEFNVGDKIEYWQVDKAGNPIKKLEGMGGDRYKPTGKTGLDADLERSNKELLIKSRAGTTAAKRMQMKYGSDVIKVDPITGMVGVNPNYASQVEREKIFREWELETNKLLPKNMRQAETVETSKQQANSLPDNIAGQIQEGHQATLSDGSVWQKQNGVVTRVK